MITIGWGIKECIKENSDDLNVLLKKSEVRQVIWCHIISLF